MTDSRRSTRHKVHLSVRYATAQEFVREYAENLSKGGLFLKGAHTLSPMQLVHVRVELPGFRKHNILAEVAHIVTPEQAAADNRAAGAGLAIVGSSDQFGEVLEQYLRRLGQRKDHMVLIADEPAGILLGSSGYRVKRAPPPGDIRDLVVSADRPVLGVIVPGALVGDYERELADLEPAGTVRDIASFEDIDNILAWLDQRLMRRLSAGNPSAPG